MTVTTLHNTPASQAGDAYDQLQQAKAAFEAADALVEKVAGNINAFHNLSPHVGGSFGPYSGMVYAMTRLQGELETLEQEVDQLRAQLRGGQQASG